MKLSLITTAAVVATTAALTFTLTHTLQPAQATKAATPTQAEMPVLAPIAPNTIPAQIGGQKLTAEAQTGVNCLIVKNNDQTACGQDALNREIAKCLGGIGINGGCFDFFNKQAIAAAPAKPTASTEIKTPRRNDARSSANGSHRARIARNDFRIDDLRMMALDWF